MNEINKYFTSGTECDILQGQREQAGIYFSNSPS